MSKSFIIVLVLLAAGLAYAVMRPSEQQRAQREIQEMNRTLPRTIGQNVTMKRIELENKTVKSWYSIAATFETDPETTAAVRKVLMQTACADAKFRDILKKGYTFDNFVDVDTPHGPGQFHIAIASGDCV